MRFSAPLALFISALLPSVFSAPVIPRDHVNLNNRPSSLDSVATYATPNVQHITGRSVREFEDVYARNDKRPGNAKITFGNAAKAKLDELGLHGKARKQVKTYHKNIVKQDMKEHGAHTARIFHLTHEGGHDPNERNHITAGYYAKPAAHGQPGKQIKSPWAKKHEAANPGQTTKGLFHVYPGNRKPPSAWTKAADASASRKAAEKAHADAHAAAHSAAKAEAVHQNKQAGQALSPEAKAAQRKAAKEAKKAKKGGA